MTDPRGRAYFSPESIDTELFHITSERKPEPDYARALDQLSKYVEDHRRTFLGFQSTASLETKHLSHFVEAAINNIGDAFADPSRTAPGQVSKLADGYFSLNCKWVERAVLDYYAERWQAGAPRKVAEDEVEDWRQTYWGYVLSMGSTEGNLMAIRSARDYLKGRTLLYEEGGELGPDLHYEECDHLDDSAFNPILLYSAASHYSVRKLAQMLELESQVIKIDEHQRMDLDDLLVVAKHVLHVDRRPLAVLFNYGTTWTGALDDVEAAIPRLMEEIQKAGMAERTIYTGRRPLERQGYWFHVDGALGAGYGTHVERDGEFALPKFGFDQGVQSIVMSGHKWPGAPWPTGVYMTQNRYMLTNDVPSYVGSLDSTLAGSRSGIASIFLWDYLVRSSDAERRAEGERQLDLARYAHEQLVARWDPQARRAPGSLIVTFASPGEELANEYSLSLSGDDAHLVCVRHVTRELVDEFLAKLDAPAAPSKIRARARRAGRDRARLGW